MICEITFSAAIEVSGKDIRSIREKFENTPLFHPVIDKICYFNDIEQVIRVDDEIEEDFLLFDAGTSKFDVWHWFDDRRPNNLHDDLLYPSND